jgi:hypothetical protein
LQSRHIFHFSSGFVEKSQKFLKSRKLEDLEEKNDENSRTKRVNVPLHETLFVDEFGHL